MNATVVATHWRQSQLVPILLITIGVVLLGANAGVISRDVPHALLHLSPAILILVGIELLFRRGARALALESVVMAVLIVLAVIAPDLLISGAPPGHAH